MTTFDPIRDHPPSATDLLAAFDAAVAEDKLELHYQPMLDAASGRVVGVEGLMRCPDGRGGCHVTANLIPALGAKRARALGEAAVRQAVAQHRTWKNRGLPVRISVNVLPQHVGDGDFTAWLLDEASNGGLVPGDLMLEITERPVAAGSAVEDGMRLLAGAGFPLALDSFGSGFSNLAHMRDLSIGLLKTDRAFGGRLHLEDGRRIIEAMFGFCRALGFEMTVVGIESLTAAAHLADLGVASLQGFHFARPMSAADCTDWLTGARPS